MEILPGLLSWGTLIGLGVLAFIVPTWVAIFLILYDLYWLIRAVYIATHLIAAYRTLKRHRGINWMERLQLLADLPQAERATRKTLGALKGQTTRPDLSRSGRSGIRTALWQEREFLTHIQQLQNNRTDILPWQDVLHVVIIPTYDEPLLVLQATLDALQRADYPKEKLWVVVALEERAGAHTQLMQEHLTMRYGGAFGRFMTTVHPDGIAGEKKVKSANGTWAAKLVQKDVDAMHIPYDRVVVSNFDSDTCVGPDYFAYLTYVYVTNPHRTRASYQPLPLYHNNIWDAPAFTRVIATNSAFWQMIEAIRPDRLVTFSSHSMSFAALVDVGFWSVDVVSEDSRIFWQCFLKYGGRYETVPLFTNVSMDATNASTLWRTFVNQYKQKRRWAWGIEHFPFLAHAFLHHRDIPLKTRLKSLWIMLEGNHSWATSALIIAILGWIPVLFGGAQFHSTVLSYNLPYVTRTLMTLAMGGLVITMSLTLLLLPPAPAGTPKRKYAYMVLQWALVPIIASVLGSLPALDAQTRLMIGKPLGFWVTEKSRKPDAPVTA